MKLINRRSLLAFSALFGLGCYFRFFKVNLGQLTVNIEDFKVVRDDGAVDDTQGLLSALNYLKKNGGGRLYIPAGEYFISLYTQFNVFYGFMDIEIFGDGDSSVLILCKGSLSFGGFSNLTLRRIKFSRDLFEANSGRKKYQINMSSFDGLVIDDVTFSDFGITDNGFPVAGSTILMLYAGSKTGAVTSADTDFISGSSRNFKIINSRFIAGGDRSVNFGIRVYTEFIVTELETMSDGFVQNCTFDGFNWNALEILGPKTTDIKVDGCRVSSGGVTGIEIDKGASYCSIENCKFYNLSGNIDVENYPNTAIVGVLLQGDVTHNLIGYSNHVKNIVVYISETAYAYPNDIIGIGMVDVRDSTVEDVIVTLSPLLSNRIAGQQIAIFVSGEYSGCKIQNSSLSGFNCGVSAKNIKFKGVDGPVFLIKNIVFSKNLSPENLLSCSRSPNFPGLIYKDLRFNIDG